MTDNFVITFSNNNEIFFRNKQNIWFVNAIYNSPRDYYGEKYDIREYTPLPIPDNDEVAKDIPKSKYRELPPWNDFGSYEDSAQNCITVETKPPHKDFKSF